MMEDICGILGGFIQVELVGHDGRGLMIVSHGWKGVIKAGGGAVMDGPTVTFCVIVVVMK